MRRVGPGWSFEEALATAPLRAGDVLVLCNPHNPTGTCHPEDELRRIGAICEAIGLTVVSDEAFCDLVIDPACEHRPFASLDADHAWRSITLISPAKGFNIPGASCAFMIAPDPAKREAAVRELDGTAGKVQALSLEATWAAYEAAEDWRGALVAYLRENSRYLRERCAGWTGFEACPTQAGFLAWIDVRPRLADDLAAFLRDRAGVVLGSGRQFGDPGFLRLNFGCPRPLLACALDAIEAVIDMAPEGPTGSRA